MTLYSLSDVESHRTRIALNEKGILTEVIEMDRGVSGNKRDDLRKVNPYQIIPTLIDRDLVLYQSKIIIEYLEERFPYPPLLPVFPILRARFRLMVFQIEQDWYPLVSVIQGGEGDKAEEARQTLREGLAKMAEVFENYPYCLSEEFSFIDCSIAPILWRLPALGIHFADKKMKPLLDYAERLFKRDTFKKSLTDTEAEFRN